MNKRIIISILLTFVGILNVWAKEPVADSIYNSIINTYVDAGKKELHKITLQNAINIKNGEEEKNTYIFGFEEASKLAGCSNCPYHKIYDNFLNDNQAKDINTLLIRLNSGLRILAKPEIYVALDASLGEVLVQKIPFGNTSIESWLKVDNEDNASLWAQKHQTIIGVKQAYDAIFTAITTSNDLQTPTTAGMEIVNICMFRAFEVNNIEDYQNIGSIISGKITTSLVFFSDFKGYNDADINQQIRPLVLSSFKKFPFISGAFPESGVINDAFQDKAIEFASQIEKALKDEIVVVNCGEQIVFNPALSSYSNTPQLLLQYFNKSFEELCFKKLTVAQRIEILSILAKGNLLGNYWIPISGNGGENICLKVLQTAEQQSYAEILEALATTMVQYNPPAPTMVPLVYALYHGIDGDNSKEFIQLLIKLTHEANDYQTKFDVLVANSNERQIFFDKNLSFNLEYLITDCANKGINKIEFDANTFNIKYKRKQVTSVSYANTGFPLINGQSIIFCDSKWTYLDVNWIDLQPFDLIHFTNRAELSLFTEGLSNTKTTIVPAFVLYHAKNQQMIDEIITTAAIAGDIITLAVPVTQLAKAPLWLARAYKIYQYAEKGAAMANIILTQIPTAGNEKLTNAVTAFNLLMGVCGGIDAIRGLTHLQAARFVHNVDEATAELTTLANGTGQGSEGARELLRIRDEVFEEGRKTYGGSDFVKEICKKNCFVAGTPITTEKGLVPIEKVTTNDFVLSKNTFTNEISYKPVLQTYIEKIHKVYVIKAGTETIRTTSEHPFWINNSWKFAKDIKEGDLLTTNQNTETADAGSLPYLARSSLEVDDVSVIDSVCKVYNFEVKDFNTYYLGNTGILVHNTNIDLGCLLGIPAFLNFLDGYPNLQSKVNNLGESVAKNFHRDFGGDATTLAKMEAYIVRTKPPNNPNLTSISEWINSNQVLNFDAWLTLKIMDFDKESTSLHSLQKLSWDLAKFPDLKDDLVNFSRARAYWKEITEHPDDFKSEELREMLLQVEGGMEGVLYRVGKSRFFTEFINGPGKKFEQYVSDSYIENYLGSIISNFTHGHQIHLVPTKHIFFGPTPPNYTFTKEKIIADDLFYKKSNDELWQAILHDSKLTQDAPWTSNQKSSLITPFQNDSGLQAIEFEVRSTNVSGIEVGDKIRVSRFDIYKTYGGPDSRGKIKDNKMSELTLRTIKIF